MISSTFNFLQYFNAYGLFIAFFLNWQVYLDTMIFQKIQICKQKIRTAFVWSAEVFVKLSNESRNVISIHWGKDAYRKSSRLEIT